MQTRELGRSGLFVSALGLRLHGHQRFLRASHPHPSLLPPGAAAGDRYPGPAMRQP